MCASLSVCVCFGPAQMKRVVTESGGNIITEVYVSVISLNAFMAFAMSDL